MGPSFRNGDQLINRPFCHNERARPARLLCVSDTACALGRKSAANRYYVETSPTSSSAGKGQWLTMSHCMLIVVHTANVWPQWSVAI